MANILERLKGKLQKPNNGRELEVRREKVPQPALPPLPRTPPAYPASGTVVLNCVCAVHDRPYQLRFTRQATGKLRFIESVTLPGDARAGSRRNGQAAASSSALQSISLDDFENQPWPCGWCGNPTINHCSQNCGSLVCGGKMEGRRFTCRTSCAAVWEGVPMREIQATNEQQTRPAKPQTAPQSALRSESLPAVAPANRGSNLPSDADSRALVIRK
jgi:hypothetical protein